MTDMRRRMFLYQAGLAQPALVSAQQGRMEQGRTDAARLARMAPGVGLAIVMNRLGFLAGGGKSVLYRLSGSPAPSEFTMREIGSVTPPFRFTRPYPHSRYEGLTIGGIMAGMGGDVNDEPMQDMEYGLDYHTTEYWLLHNAWYLWTHSVLEKSETSVTKGEPLL